MLILLKVICPFLLLHTNKYSLSLLILTLDFNLVPTDNSTLSFFSTSYIERLTGLTSLNLKLFIIYQVITSSSIVVLNTTGIVF